VRGGGEKADEGGDGGEKTEFGRETGISLKRKKRNSYHTLACRQEYAERWETNPSKKRWEKVFSE